MIEKLTPVQQLRFECIISAFETLNCEIDNDQQQSDPYATAEEMVKYILDGKIPVDSNLN